VSTGQKHEMVLCVPSTEYLLAIGWRGGPTAVSDWRDWTFKNGVGRSTATVDLWFAARYVRGVLCTRMLLYYRTCTRTCTESGTCVSVLIAKRTPVNSLKTMMTEAFLSVVIITAIIAPHKEVSGEYSVPAGMALLMSTKT
jgi:hypothetical protein